MALAHSKLTAQGQISVPSEVRKRLGIGPGSVLEWEEKGGEVVVRRAGRYSSADVHAAVFELEAAQIATAVDMLLNHEHLTLQDADVVAAALEKLRKRPAVSFTDNLILEIARKSGHLPLGAFDRDLAKLEGTERL